MLSLILANRGMTLSQTRERYFEWTLLGLILILGMILFYEALPFLNGALGAITLYLLLRRTNIYLSRRFSPRAAPWIITLTVTLFVLLPLSALTWYVIDMVQNVNIDLQAIIKRFTNTLNYLEQVTHYDLMSEKTVAFITAKATGVMNMLMSGINNTAINLFTAILLLFFLLSGGMKMERAIARCLPFNDTNKRAITSKISTIVRSNAIGIPLLALIQGVVATVGYSFCDVKNPIEFGALTGFASMIPIVGSMLVWVPLAVMQYFEQGLLSAIYVGAYGALIISQCDNILRMILQKRMANTHPLITIFGVIAGLPLFGFMGLIFGPLMVAMFLLFLEMFVSQYIIGTDISPVSNRHTPSMRALMPNKKQGSKVNKTTLDSSKAKAVTARGLDTKGLDTKGLDSAPTRAYKGNSPQAEQMAVQALLQRGKTQAQNRAAMRQTSRATKVATKEATKVATKANAGSAIKDSDTTKTVTQAKAQTETAVTAKAATASATTNKNDARKSTTAITKDKANAGESSAQSQSAAQSAAQPTAQLATQALSQPQAQPEKQAAVPASDLQQGPEPSTTVATARPELKLSNAKAKAKTKNDFKSAKAEHKQSKREGAKLRALEEQKADERNSARALLEVQQSTTGFKTYLEPVDRHLENSTLTQSIVSRAVSQAMNTFGHFNDLDPNAHYKMDPELMEHTTLMGKTSRRDQIRHGKAQDKQTPQPQPWAQAPQDNRAARKQPAAKAAQQHEHAHAGTTANTAAGTRTERHESNKRTAQDQKRNTGRNLGRDKERGYSSNRNGNAPQRTTQQRSNGTGSVKEHARSKGKEYTGSKATASTNTSASVKGAKASNRAKGRNASANATFTDSKQSSRRSRKPSNLSYQVMRPERKKEQKSQDPILQTIISHQFGGYEAPRSHTRLRTQLVSVHTAKGTMMAKPSKPIRRRPSNKRPYHH